MNHEPEDKDEDMAEIARERGWNYRAWLDNGGIDELAADYDEPNHTEESF